MVHQRKLMNLQLSNNTRMETTLCDPINLTTTSTTTATVTTPNTNNTATNNNSNNDNNNNNDIATHPAGALNAPTDDTQVTPTSNSSNQHLDHEAIPPNTSNNIPACVVENDGSTTNPFTSNISTNSNVNIASENNNKIKISNEERTVSTDESNQDANLKIRRCRHGRIIVKDSSKKKLVQLGDRETNKQLKTVEGTSEVIHQSSSSSKTNETLQKQTCDDLNEPKISSKLIENDIADGKTSSNEHENSPRSDKTREVKEISPVRHASSSLRRNRSRSPALRRDKSRNRSPASKRRDSRSPSHRKSPRRGRDMYRSRSPRSKRSRSRSPRYRRVSPRRTSSSKRTIQTRSPHRRDRESSNQRPYRQSSRNESPRRKRSESRSKSRSRSPVRSRRDTSRSPYRDRVVSRRDRLPRFGQSTDRVEPPPPPLPRKEIFRNSLKSLGVIQNQDVPNKQNHSISDNNSSHQLAPIIKSQDDTKPLTQHDNQIVLNSPIDLNAPHKTAQLEASPKKSLSARSSMTFSTDDSPSSDIYDPEGPVLPISPGDSPPLSPLNQAANHKITYQMDVEKNDDDGVPSSAVQLNHQEKYLQKLNRQERVVEEVKLALKPHYQRRAIDKEQYKDVLRRAVPKVCHSKNGEINPVKIRSLVDAYVKKMKRHK